MRISSAAELAAAIGARLTGPGEVPVGPDVVIDTRKATPGSLFVALPGERVDGHDFTTAAARAGAAAVLASRATDADLPHLLVADSQQGLTDLARHLVAVEHSRPGTPLRTIALTGSSGKTSTKDILAQLLEAAGTTVSPVGSFNNEIGVPLTACGIDQDTDFLISEMGARGKGHIAWLTSIVPPDVAMVLNVGTAHLGVFGSRDAIAAAKGEIVEALGADGWAVLDAADFRVAAMTARTPAQIAWFSPDADHRHPEAAIEGWADRSGSDDLGRYHFQLHLRTPGGQLVEAVQLRTLGGHQVANAVAAAVAAACCGMAPDRIAAGLSAATTRSPWRMELDERADGLVVINDCYNANPDSMRAAIDTLAGILERRRASDPQTRGIAILGDMRELGADSAELHREAGRQAARAGFDEVLCIGERAEDLASGVTEGGSHARVVDAAQARVSLDWSRHDVVLVKASRALGLEKLAAAILADEEGRA